VDDPSSIWQKRVFDHVIYLHGSTCTDKIGLTMTFAHELQHVVQYVTVPNLLSANNLVRLLPKQVIESLGLQWSDIPTEREARATAKRVAVKIHGSETVRQFIAQRAAAAVDPTDIKDWRFIQELEPSNPYSVVDETAVLFGRLRGHRHEFEKIIEERKSDPEFQPINLDCFMNR
jgi:hypothetical protein